MPLPLNVGSRFAFVRDSPDRIAAAIVLPQDTPCTRQPVQTGTERTAVLPFQSTGTVLFNTNNLGVVQALMFRHAISPLWVTGTFSTQATSYNCEANFVTGDNAFYKEKLELTGNVSWLNVGGYPSWFANLSNITATPNIPTATDQLLGSDYFYVPGTSGLAYAYLQCKAGSMAGNLNCDLFLWLSPGDEQPVNTTFYVLVMSGGSGTLFVPAPTQGWYRWGNIKSAGLSNAGLATSTVLTCGWSTNGSLPASSGTVTGLWPFNPPPDFGNVSNYPWASTRTNASAALFTNISQVVEKQGTVLAARLAATDTPFNFQQSVCSTRTPIEKYFGAFETGLYAFTSPSPESQVYRPAYREGVFAGGNGLPITFTPWIQLADSVYYNAITFTDSSSSPYPMIAVTSDWHIEFRSSSPLFPPSISTTALEAVHQAHLAVAGLNNFSENPTHKMLRGMVVTAAHTVARGALGPYYKPAAMMAGAAHNYLRQNVPGSHVQSNGTGKAAQPNKPKMRGGLDMFLASKSGQKWKAQQPKGKRGKGGKGRRRPPPPPNRGRGGRGRPPNYPTRR